jgi:hypothetical protein
MKKISRKHLLPRQENWRESKLFIIAAEGEVTEKQYFSIFRSTRIQVKVLPTPNDGTSAPKYVLKRLNEFNEQYELDDEDELWLVFDVDRWESKNLSAICREAYQKGYKLAISNPCFETWLCLHFADLDHHDKTCKDFKMRLRKILGSYKSNNLDLEKYHNHVQDAINRATPLGASKQEYWPSNFGTHVYKLAEAILASING